MVAGCDDDHPDGWDKRSDDDFTGNYENLLPLEILTHRQIPSSPSEKLNGSPHARFMFQRYRRTEQESRGLITGIIITILPFYQMPLNISHVTGVCSRPRSR